MSPGPVTPVTEQTINDIEHIPVPDDPRAWSHARKTLTLVTVSSASMIASLATNSQNPANAQIEQSLHASSSDISWTLSIFVLVQGLSPIVWSAIGEIKGRKIVYLSSMSLFIIGSAVVATSNSIGLIIGMRGLQAIGSGAVMAMAAATLADIYEPHERGTKMGIYYTVPLLGTSMGPFVGGILAQAFGWRAVFWFVAIIGGIVLAFLFFFKDSFRKERSLSYQNVLRRRLGASHLSTIAPSQIVVAGPSTDESQQTPSKKTVTMLETGMTFPDDLDMKNITLSFMDVNPFSPLVLVLRRWNNNAILVASGLIFGFTYSLAYTCARTLSISYGYDALHTGIVLLSNGAGSICGSILGGRWSDRVLMKLKLQHGGETHPEMRLQSTVPVMLWPPLSTIGYAWVCQTHQPVGTICIMLFIATFSAAWIYSSTLAYIVDANKGRSSTAVAVNSVYRGMFAFVAAEVAIPLQNSIGDGRMYTIWAGLLIVMEILVLLVLKYGKQWREKCEEAENKNDI